MVQDYRNNDVESDDGDNTDNDSGRKTKRRWNILDSWRVAGGKHLHFLDASNDDFNTVLHAGASEECVDEEESDAVQHCPVQKALTKKQQKYAYTEADRKALLKSYSLWKDSNPELYECFIGVLDYDNEKVYKVMVKIMKIGWDCSCCTDTGHLKEMIIDIIPQSPELLDKSSDILNPPISRTSKIKCSRKHPKIHTLLCSWSYLWRIWSDNKEEHLKHEELEQEKIKFSENNLFAFMYDLRLYDPKSRITSLLCGYLIPWTVL
ncbi:hypothetical protein Moror_680 [Moniliophthora roreri MCA 2997]|uniref:Uncharacterized protein n=1 Tax=Moniliophthora roreri (strain MCA 2997) TaxID=1381753 RepID=V2WMZ0_MONRO|nr:hypothetical protein Moror_680 [Moniliophthora roreri MCA 2997]